MGGEAQLTNYSQRANNFIYFYQLVAFNDFSAFCAHCDLREPGARGNSHLITSCWAMWDYTCVVPSTLIPAYSNVHTYIAAHRPRGGWDSTITSRFLSPWKRSDERWRSRFQRDISILIPSPQLYNYLLSFAIGNCRQPCCKGVIFLRNLRSHDETMASGTGTRCKYIYNIIISQRIY